MALLCYNIPFFSLFLVLLSAAAVPLLGRWERALALVRWVQLAVAGLSEQQTAMLSIMFSWPQGVTALCGGLLSWPIIARLKKVQE